MNIAPIDTGFDEIAQASLQRIHFGQQCKELGIGVSSGMGSRDVTAVAMDARARIDQYERWRAEADVAGSDSAARSRLH